MKPTRYNLIMQFVNNFKSLTYNYKELQHRRLSITSKEIDQYWENKTLKEMTAIFTITEDLIINYILTQLLQPILANRKVIYEAYIAYKVINNEQTTCLYAYDCKIFRNVLYSKEENQFISSFLLCYKQLDEINEPVYELIDVDKIQSRKWLLLVKQSSILRVYSYIKEAFKKSTDKIIMEQTKYLNFMQEWTKCYFNYRLEIMINSFFKGVLALLENQILLDYVESLTAQEKYERMYILPIKIIEKPKNIEQFTQTQKKHLGQVSWQTLKIVLYQLKYSIKQQENVYICNRIKQDIDEQVEELCEEDHKILLAFSNLQREEQQYQNSNYQTY